MTHTMPRTITIHTHIGSAFETRVQSACAISASEERIVTVYTSDPTAVLEELVYAGTRDVEDTDGTPCVEVWGTDEDGDEWCLRLAPIIIRGERERG